VIGILISTASLVILLSAFNGIEYMVKQLYSDFDASITIRFAKGKTFDKDTFPYEKLKLPEIAEYSQSIEEIVILKHEQKWSNAYLYGVEPSFLKMSKMKTHLVDGEAILQNDKFPLTLVGAGLMEKLQAYVHDERDDYEYLEVYFPLREAKMKMGSNPFNNEHVRVSAAYNFNRDVNMETLVVPLDFAQEKLMYDTDISSIYVHIPIEKNIVKIQDKLKKELGKDWIVKTQFEKNELIYKTSKTEKMIVVVILVFVFIISAFNLMTAIIMSMLEKKKDILTMYSFGATKSTIFNVFFYNGMMVAMKGITLGLILGYAICAAQLYFGLVRIPNINNDVFPIKIYFMDGLMIVSIVLGLSLLATFVPVKYLLSRLKRTID
jgi:lipoprotein-releasing system permease protein